MTNEDLLQQVLNSTIERMGRQSVQHEAEVANLSSQIIILNSQIKDMSEGMKEKPSKVTPAKNS